MLLEFLIVVGILWIFFNFIQINFLDFRKRPPGPLQWPLIGNIGNILLANPKFIHLGLETLAKKYGEVMSLKYGVHNLVILSSFKAMKDLLTKDEVSGHHVFPATTDRAFGKNLGKFIECYKTCLHSNHGIGYSNRILMSSGEIWRESKRVTVRGLRDFGFGRKMSMDIIIREELIELISQLKKFSKDNNGIVTIENTFTLSVTNIIWSLIAGYRFSHGDEALKKMLRYNDEFNMVFSSFYIPFPFLRMWFPMLTKFYLHKKAYKAQQDFIKGLLDKFRKELSTREKYEDDKPRNFIETLLKKQKADPFNEIFSDENITIILLDLFLAGSETTSNTLSYSILYMILHPEVQRKIQAEVSETVSENIELTASDIKRMPYTKACIFEIFRLSNVVPLPIARTTTSDVIYKEFFIPKGTGILCNNQTNFYDKEFWGDPEVFRPERFLDERNNLIKTDRVTAFGFGKHACLGESLAWDTIFLFLTTLLRNFTFECVPEEPKPLLSDPREGYFTLAPNPFNVAIKATI